MGNKKLDEAEKKEVMKQRILAIALILFGAGLAAGCIFGCVRVAHTSINAKIFTMFTCDSVIAGGFGVFVASEGLTGLVQTYLNPYKQREVELQNMCETSTVVEKNGIV